MRRFEPFQTLHTNQPYAGKQFFWHFGSFWQPCRLDVLFWGGLVVLRTLTMLWVPAKERLLCVLVPFRSGAAVSKSLWLMVT
jgi:hypothetical protein